MRRRAPRSEPSEETPQAYSIPALEKGLDVLEYLSRAHQPLGLNEVAVALGRSRQELFRVMVCLHGRGYLLRDATGRYRLGSKMFEVGSRHFARQALVSLAMPPMEDLAVTAGESCQLSVVERDRLLVIATAVGSAQLQLEVKVGSSIPLYNSVIGLVAIAFTSEACHREAWRRRREALRAGGDVIEPDIPEYGAWQERLAAIRRDGCLVAQSPVHPGSRVHAAPLLNAVGNLIGILSLTRLVPVREPPERAAAIVAGLVACARSISAGFGAGEATNGPELHI
jgi:DNA-binding IclR family transcriptional regulator